MLHYASWDKDTLRLDGPTDSALIMQVHGTKFHQDEWDLMWEE